MNPYSLKPLPSDIQASLANKFRVLRKAQGYSQEETAKRSGVSLGSLKRFENTGQISLESLLKLSHLLDRLDDFKTVFAQGEDMKQIEKLFKS
ncbi:MAG: helix-turn-helix transcriptional regulator [Saprospiraceae bacterium]|nr:helix-turn-helix transcriptional regulator [Saprospiraceae bacterium]